MVILNIPKCCDIPFSKYKMAAASTLVKDQERLEVFGTNLVWNIVDHA